MHTKSAKHEKNCPPYPFMHAKSAKHEKKIVLLPSLLCTQKVQNMKKNCLPPFTFMHAKSAKHEKKLSSSLHFYAHKKCKA